jgi:hypothetical protein
LLVRSDPAQAGNLYSADSARLQSDSQTLAAMSHYQGRITKVIYPQ